MPVILKIDLRRRIVYSSFYGRVTDDELLKHRSAIASDPQFNPEFSEIVDLTAVTEVAVTEKALATMAGTESLYSPSGLHIVVAPSRKTGKLAKDFKTLAQYSRPNLHIVRTRAEAYKLLSTKRK
jgi:hypothetical protein